jgi:DNA-binding CsgD family transcriptional regulator
MALRSILWDMFPGVELSTYSSFDEFFADSQQFFVHFFVSDTILFQKQSEFDQLKRQTIVLTHGASPILNAAGYKSIDITLPEADLVKALLHIHEGGHHAQSHNPAAHGGVPQMPKQIKGEELTDREKEVLSLIVKGFINKEIADKLNLSLPTVVFHRNNICEKLHTRSIGRLTVFAVFSGIVDLSEI